jgi:hypothetical protein
MGFYFCISTFLSVCLFVSLFNGSQFANVGFESLFLLRTTFIETVFLLYFFFFSFLQFICLLSTFVCLSFTVFFYCFIRFFSFSPSVCLFVLLIALSAKSSFDELVSVRPSSKMGSTRGLRKIVRKSIGRKKLVAKIAQLAENRTYVKIGAGGF